MLPIYYSPEKNMHKFSYKTFNYSLKLLNFIFKKKLVKPFSEKYPKYLHKNKKINFNVCKERKKKLNYLEIKSLFNVEFQ